MRVWGQIFACELEPGMVILGDDGSGDDELEIVHVDLHLPHPYEVVAFGLFDFETFRDRDRVLVKVSEEWYQLNREDSP